MYSSTLTPWMEMGVSFGRSQVHHHFLSLHVKLKVILLAPGDKLVHSSPELPLVTTADASNHYRVIRELPKVAGLCSS